MLVAVVAALSVAVGAYGASKITGHDIAKNTITGSNVKNHSLRPKDFRGRLRGPRGRRGAKGPRGSIGPTGPRGPVGAAGGPRSSWCSGG